MPEVNTSELDAALHLIGAVDADSADFYTEVPAVAPLQVFDATLDTARLEAIVAADTLEMRADTVSSVAPPEPWSEGLMPEPRLVQPGRSESFLTLIALLFVAMAFNFRTISRLLRFYGEELVKVRRGRDNVFDDRPAGDLRVLVLLVIQCVVCTGILLAGGVSGWVARDPALMTVRLVVTVIAVIGAYYVFQFAAYQVVGYTFATGEGRREWMRGFNASQALLGVALTVPAVVGLFYPHTMAVMAAAGLVLYLAARILFIFKGFRIFYDKISSLLYFILYLCTLEIIPLLLVYKCSVSELI